MENEKTPFERIADLVSGMPENSTSFISIATIIGATLRRVLAAEKTCELASISLAHREQLAGLREQTSRMIEALGSEMPAHVSLEKVSPDDEKTWWFALSEVTHVLEESIDQLSGMVARQEKGSSVRDLTALYVRLLREHYNFYFDEARKWMDG